MSLKVQVLRAIAKMRSALQDLIFTAQLVKREKKGYVPGTSVQYLETTYDVQTVITQFDESELDSDRVNVTDVKLLVFPLDDVSVIPKSNDVIVVKGENYRIVKNDPIYAGSDIALHVIQARPSGQG